MLNKYAELGEHWDNFFSREPLRFALSGGMLFAILAFVYGLYAVIMVRKGRTVPGWASVIASVVFLSGVQLVVLGVIGEFIGKIYREVTQRPAYIISKTNISNPSRNRESHLKLEPLEGRSAMT